METTDNILQNCMFWLTDISNYRCRLKKLQQYLQTSKTRFSLQGKYENFINLTRDVQTAMKKLQSIESRVIHAINMHQNELYVPSLTKWSELQNENELFDHMMYANKIVVELQRAVHYCFEENKEVDHTSILIEMPAIKKIKHRQA